MQRLALNQSLEIQEVFLGPLAERELSKIERSFKLISVVLSERGSKETLGDRFALKSVGMSAACFKRPSI